MTRPTRESEPLATYFNSLAQREHEYMLPDVQRCIDEAISALEWDPEPADSTDLGTGDFTVFRCGVWIVYSFDRAKGELDLWRFVREW